ncbi:MAG: tryptophan synthase subunit alpha [Desulfonatronovibrionaceae bacterium]
MQTNILRTKIDNAVKEGRKALIPFVPAGYPALERFWDIIFELDATGADIIEIGIPFSDPVADGPVVEKASIRCLEQGVSLSWLMEGLGKHRKNIRAGIVLMGYFNPFLQFGLTRLAELSRETGANGLIIPDLILEEASCHRQTLAAGKLSLVPLVGLNTPEARMHCYAEHDPDFVYLVSVLGTTGTRAGKAQLLRSKLQEVRKCFSCPVALGFGLSSRDQLDSIAHLVDAVVFGSALIEHIDQGKSPGDFMKAWL